MSLILFKFNFVELSKTTKVLSNTIKDVAASETNLQLQEILFQLSNKYDILEHNLEKQYKEESEQNNVLLEQMKSAIIAPLRVSVICRRQ